MSKYIKTEDVREKMYHEAFETDTDMQKWDSGCWIRYKLFENVIESVEGVDVDKIIDEHIGEYLAARCQVLVSAEAMNQRRAHWIKRRGGKYVCSNCSIDALFDNTTCMVPSRYCPSCGRWMCGPIEDLTEEG